MTKKEYFRVCLILLLLAGIGGGVYWVIQEKKERDFWEAQKPRIELFLKHNFTNIETVEYGETIKTPMSVGIKGYVNGDPEAGFTATVRGYEEEFNSGIMIDKKLDDLLVNKDRVTPVDEIEENQKETVKE